MTVRQTISFVVRLAVSEEMLQSSGNVLKWDGRSVMDATIC